MNPPAQNQDWNHSLHLGSDSGSEEKKIYISGKIHRLFKICHLISWRTGDKKVTNAAKCIQNHLWLTTLLLVQLAKSLVFSFCSKQPSISPIVLLTWQAGAENKNCNELCWHSMFPLERLYTKCNVCPTLQMIKQNAGKLNCFFKIRAAAILGIDPRNKKPHRA